VSAGHDEYRPNGSHEPVATLVRSVPVRLIEVSRGGCRLESASPIESGTSGQLAVLLQGLMRIDDVRVARCQLRAGAGPVYQVGAELLRTRRLGRRTVRMAVRRIISGIGADGLFHGREPVPPPPETRADEEVERSGSRAPPPRGSSLFPDEAPGHGPRKH
jgi:hypothetical protein